MPDHQAVQPEFGFPPAFTVGTITFEDLILNNLHQGEQRHIAYLAAAGNTLTTQRIGTGRAGVIGVDADRGGGRPWATVGVGSGALFTRRLERGSSRAGVLELDRWRGTRGSCESG